MASAPVITAVTQWAQNTYSSPWLRIGITNNGPYNQGMSVERQKGDGTGAITTIAGWGSDDGSTGYWIDTTAGADNYWQYRVKGVHNGTTYTSAWKKGHTLPASPAPLTPVRSTGQVSMTWTNKSASGYIAYRVYKGATLLTTTAANASSYTDAAAANTGALTYTLYAYILGGIDLEARSGTAGWVPLSVTLPAPAKANPPTLTPSATALNLATTALVINVAHNPVDYTAQTSGNVRYRQVGGSTWTTVSLGTGTSITVPAGTLTNGLDYEFQGQTAGMAGGLSDWSASVIVSGANNPTTAITTPANGASVNTGTVNVGWSYASTDGRPQAGWEVKLLVGGVQVDGASGSGAVLSWTSGLLSNSTAYTINVRVMNSAGLWSTVASSTFNASFPPPPGPTVTPSWDPDTGQVTLAYVNPAPGGGQAAAVSNSIYRSGVLLASGLPLNSTYTDLLPALNTPVDYKVVAITAGGSPGTTALTVTTTMSARKWFFLNGGPDFSVLARLREQASVSAAPALDGSLVWYEGRRLPVAYDGQGYTNAIRLQGEVRGLLGSPDDPDLIGTWEPFAALAGNPGRVWYRDVFGRSFLAKASGWSIVHDSQGPEAAITVTLTEVDPT